MPIPLAAMATQAVGPAISGLFGMAGGKAQAKAAKYAADLQSQGANKALDFTKQSAESDWQTNEVNRRANYDQWAAREQRMGTLGQMFGFGPRAIPGYVPGMDPNLNASPQGQPGMPNRRYVGNLRDLL